MNQYSFNPVRMKTILIIWLAFSLFLSCNRFPNNADLLLQGAEKAMEDNPVEALSLLYDIPNPKRLNQEQQALYYLRLVEALDKTGKEIAEDTLIFQSLNYFKEEKDIKNQALAELYSGRVLQSQNKIDDALRSYLSAETTAEEAKEPALTGLIESYIGELNYLHDLHSSAISKFKEAAAHFKEAKRFNDEIIIYNRIADCFLIDELTDSAFSYYNLALTFARQANNSAQQQLILQDMGVAYFNLNQPEKAKELFNQAMNLSDNDDHLVWAKIYFNIAKLYDNENQLDSASHYVNQTLKWMEQEEDLRLLSNVYKLLSEIEEKNDRQEQGLAYHKKYSECLLTILDKNGNSQMDEIQEKYNMELLQDVNNQLLIERQWIAIAAIMFFVILGIVALVFHSIRKKDKQLLLAAQQQRNLLEEMVAQKSEIVNKDQKQIKELFIKRFDVIKKITLLESVLNSEDKKAGKVALKKVNEIIYGSGGFDWTVMTDAMNQAYDGYADKMNKTIPQLSGKDFHLCCLVKAGFTNEDIAIVLNKTPNAIQLEKSYIRQKLGFGKQVSFIRQLDELVLGAS